MIESTASFTTRPYIPDIFRPVVVDSALEQFIEKAKTEYGHASKQPTKHSFTYYLLLPQEIERIRQHDTIKQVAQSLTDLSFPSAERPIRAITDYVELRAAGGNIQRKGLNVFLPVMPSPTLTSERNLVVGAVNINKPREITDTSPDNFILIGQLFTSITQIESAERILTEMKPPLIITTNVSM